MRQMVEDTTDSALSRRAVPSGAELLERGPLLVLAAFAAVRVAVPLAALASSGRALPGLPRYDYVPITGDGTGFYAASREFLAAWGRLPVPLLGGLVLAAVCGAGALVWAWRGRRLAREWLIVLGAAGFSLLVAAGIAGMDPSGAAVVGWPLLWSLPMLPYRALGFPLDSDIAFGFGLVLSVLANAVTVVATAFAGLFATGRRTVGLFAASLFAFWPLLVGLVGGTRAWGNGTWTVDAGIVMYDEPLSTALVTVALALLLSPRATPVQLAVAGVALGFGTAVKLSNALVAAAALALLVCGPWVHMGMGHLRHCGVPPFLAGVLSFAPVVVAYWPKGYAALFDNPNAWRRRSFSAEYVIRNWRDSLLFGPRTLLILVPLAVLGAVALRSWWSRLVLGAWIVGNAVLYSFYKVTPDHPRFFFASLPALFVLWTLGAFTVLETARRALRQSTAARRAGPRSRGAS
jgi:hypothetical protein